MANPPGRLVGRDAELAVADRALGRLRQGYGSAVAILGEPGIGKTRLLDEIGQLARPGEAVLHGSASEFEDAIPYSALVGALDDYVRALDTDVLGTLADHAHATLAQLLPSYPFAPSVTARRPADTQQQVHRALRDLLQAFSRRAPHIVVLDDLHWADTATTATVGALLRRPPPGRVLFLLAARTRQASTAFLSAVAHAERSGYADRLDLAPLTAGDSLRLLDPGFSSEQAHALFDASGGNPFYLEQLARTYSDVQRSTNTFEAYSDLPPLVAAALVEELEAIEPEARRYLQGAAVAGDPFDADLAAQTADLDAASDELDELLQRDVIRHTDVPRRFRFRHPLLRRAVYETTPGGWRLVAHERCATALLERGASPIVLATHIEQAGRHGDQRAIDVLTQAGQRMMARSPVDAARFLAAALRLTPADPPTDQSMELGAALATAYASGGRFGDAHRVCLETLAMLGDDRVDTDMQLTSLCASVEHWLGHHTEAHDRLLTALSRLPPSASPHTINLLTQLSIDGLFNLDVSATETWALRARDAALAMSDDLRAAYSASLAALAAALDGRATDADTSRRDAAACLDALSDDALGEHPDFLSTLAAAEHYLDQYIDARTHIDRALRLSHSAGSGELLIILYWSGIIHGAQGALRRALESLDTAIEIARLAGQDLGIASYLAIRSVVLAPMGDREGSLHSALESVDLTRTVPATLPAAMARLSCTAALLDAGQPDRALDELEPSSLPLRWRPDAYDIIARCHLSLGRPHEAAHFAASARQIAADLDLPSTRGAAERATCDIALTHGDYHAAHQHARAALAGFEEAGALIEAEKTRVRVAQCLAAAGQTGPAVLELTTAADRFDEWSAHSYRDLAERELRKLGRRQHRRSTQAPRDGTTLATLTGREREVATLVADGKTNPQIAAALYLSTKTIETHLRNTFHKLHVTSRMELARLVDRTRTPTN